ncbi:hypothetical protein SprV_0301137200 [Sparganum proliferum]
MHSKFLRQWILVAIVQPTGPLPPKPKERFASHKRLSPTAPTPDPFQRAHSANGNSARGSAPSDISRPSAITTQKINVLPHKHPSPNPSAPTTRTSLATEDHTADAPQSTIIVTSILPPAMTYTTTISTATTDENTPDVP